VKRYKVLLKQKKENKRDMLIAQRKRALEMKKVKKEAALKIERARYA
jgi:hypothetical protein